MKIPLLDLKAQFATIASDVHAAMDRVIDAQAFIQGPEVEALEREIAAYSGCSIGVGVSSGTDALLVALMALGISQGDEVITCPNTFVATAMCIARLGARAVFVDCSADDMNINVDRLESAITPRTKAIIPVHLFGQMADCARISSIAVKHGIPVIEDAAQAIGSERGGRRAGQWGTFGCLSFFPSKNLGAFGDAGMIVTNDERVGKQARLIRNHGQEPKYFSKVIAGNFRLDALQAAILRAKLPKLDGWTEARRENARTYKRLFSERGIDSSARATSDTNLLVLPQEFPGGRHVYNQFVIRSRRRDQLKNFLATKGVGTEVYYPQPMHLQECFRMWAYRKGDFPESERASEEALAIPIYAELTIEQQRYIVDAIMDFLEHHAEV